MNREVHVRIWERPEVRVLWATRQLSSKGDRFIRAITLENELSDEQRGRLLQGLRR